MRVMDRHDRLVRLLRRRADWTVAALAHELGVSRRTVLRDLGALREAGFDVDTFSGPGGGVRLNPTSVMITSQLRAGEVIALIVSVEIARAAKAVPFAAGAERALAKIEEALPATRVAELRALRERILVGEPSRAAPPADIGPGHESAGRTARPAGAAAAVVHDRLGPRPQRCPALPRGPHPRTDRHRPPLYHAAQRLRHRRLPRCQTRADPPSRVRSPTVRCGPHCARSFCSRVGAHRGPSPGATASSRPRTPTSGHLPAPASRRPAVPPNPDRCPVWAVASFGLVLVHVWRRAGRLG